MHRASGGGQTHNAGHGFVPLLTIQLSTSRRQKGGVCSEKSRPWLSTHGAAHLPWQTLQQFRL